MEKFYRRMKITYCTLINCSTNRKIRNRETSNNNEIMEFLISGADLNFVCAYRPIPPKSQLTLELNVKECSGVNFLEHVQVSTMSLTLSSRLNNSFRLK